MPAQLIHALVKLYKHIFVTATTRYVHYLYDSNESYRRKNRWQSHT